MPPRGLSTLGPWAGLVLCNALWGSQFVLVKMCASPSGPQLGPIATTAVPLLVATLLLAPLCRKRDRIAWTGRNLWDFLILGGVGQVIAQLGVTWGSQRTTASLAAMLQLALPIVTSLLALLILKEHMSLARWLALVGALLGVWIADDSAHGVDSLGDRTGNLLILAGVFGSAFYNVYSKRVLGRLPPVGLLYGTYVATCAVLIPLMFVFEPDTLNILRTLRGAQWFGLAGLAVGPYFGAMLIFLRALKTLDAVQTAASNYLIPIFGVSLGATLMGDRLTRTMLLGGLLVFGSTLVATLWTPSTTKDSV